MRIISTVPSITELLADLSLDSEVVGITKFCVHPDNWFRSKERIGGTKTLNIDKIDNLNPDLIIANKEENTREQIELLSKKYKVLVTDIKTIQDNFALIDTIASLCNREAKGLALVNKLKSTAEKIKSSLNKNALYLIWKDPYMSVGNDSYIHNVMTHLGFRNVLGDKLRYPEISVHEIETLNPEIILLSSEPYPFKEKHVQFFKNLLPQCNCMLVDGELFSWYGTRLIHLENKAITLLESIQLN